MPVNPRVMPFTKHFIELRQRFIYILIAFIILLVVFYQERAFTTIYNILTGPIKEFLPNDQLNSFVPFEAMTVRFKMAIYSALIASSPVIAYNVFAFLMPAFKKRERKWLIPTVIAALLLFLSGVAFAYFVIMGPAFEFLFGQGVDIINFIPNANSTISFIAMMLLGFGIAFELPLVVFYLIGWGILPFDTMLRSWRIAVVMIMVVAAIATPDWSPWNMFGLSAALVILFFGALLAARIVFAEKIKVQRVEQAEYDAMYAEDESDDAEEELVLPKNFDELSRKEQMIARAEAQSRARSAQ
ncbi:MAG: twin-arginine translocase subunit TatC [Actinomycetia bacterium]|nr:twin-arginine translocase subunit TatC [Actinomycetes bacterium]